MRAKVGIAIGPFLLGAVAAASSCTTTKKDEPEAHSTSQAGGRNRNTTWDSSGDVENRVNDILGKMNDQQKVDLVTGQLNGLYGLFNNAIPEVGIPALTMAHGPLGVQVANPSTNGQKATQFPSNTAIASSFDPGLVQEVAETIAQESMATGHNVQLGPTADLVRDARWGRAFEVYGEDPLLASSMASNWTTTVQSHPLMATLGHFAAYNQETNRTTVSSSVDERTLNEIHLAPFEAVVRNAHPGSVMCSFNRINGTFACENNLLNDVLKGSFGFKGFVMSDYNATPSTAGAANAGLDQEQPGDQTQSLGTGYSTAGTTTPKFGNALLDAVQNGQVGHDRLDDMARRVLRAMVGLGLFDNPVNVTPFDQTAHGAVARKAAERSIVLLKNDGILPLDPNTPKSIAVIGPDADDGSAAGGGSSLVVPTYTVSPLQGLQTRFAAAAVQYEPGVDGISEGALLPGPAPVPSSMLTTPDGASAGLTGQYWGNANFQGDPTLTRTDPNVNVNFGFANFAGFNAASPKIPSTTGNAALLGDLSARWAGKMTLPKTGDYSLVLTARGSAKLFVDNQSVLEHTGDLSTVRATVHFEAGVSRDIRIEYSAAKASSTIGGQVRFGWEHPDDVLSPAMQRAVDAAKGKDAAVVVVRDYETEGIDRPNLDLPNEQALLIRAVANANPNTVVVLETGSAVETSWQGNVRGIVNAWLPGQESGNAIAGVLSGDVNPGGKVAVTFPADQSRTPTSTSQQFPGVGAADSPVASYSEGLGVGYRGYQLLGLPSAYPFGFGLSYTTFSFDSLSVTPSETDGTDQIHVRFRVKNTGGRPGDEVAQVYVELPPGIGEPPKRLVAFSRVFLNPGETKDVDLTIDPFSLPRPLSIWDTDKKSWRVPFGNAMVDVGNSSRDIALTAPLTLRANPIPDAGPDVEDADADADADAEVDADAEADTGVDAEVDAGADAEADAGTDADADAGTDAGDDAATDAGTDADADAGIEDAGADADADADADAESP